MKKGLLTLLSVVVMFTIFFGNVNAWFGAGQTPGFSPTTLGLHGEIPMPLYKFAPDFYNIGNTLNVSVIGINPTTANITSNYYFLVSKVNQSPTGINISDGTPTIPGINENDLYSNYLSSNDVEVQVVSTNLGIQTFPSNGKTIFSGSYLTTEAGYFKFDFIDTNPSSDYNSGNILASGFFRVLNISGLTETSVTTPTPEPTTTPNNDVCANIDGIQTSLPDDSYHFDLTGKNCLQFSVPGAPGPSTDSGIGGGNVLGVSTTSGQVLGTSTMAKTGAVEDALFNSIFTLGSLLTSFGIMKNGKKKK